MDLAAKVVPFGQSNGADSICYFRYPDYIIVVCTSYHSGCTEGDVHLAGGETAMEGTVGVCHNQMWWAVSGSYFWEWDFRDAMHCCVQAFTLPSKL